jgi:putative SOS response-associated peptidase YedK
VKDGRPFTFAGLWENWKDPESAEWLRTCTIIIGEPNELVAQIHPRMPVILPEQHPIAKPNARHNDLIRNTRMIERPVLERQQSL